MATATKTANGLNLSCPFCGASEGTTIDLNDLATCICSNCSEEFSPQDALAKVAAELAKWKVVFRLAETAEAAANDLGARGER